MCVETLRKWLGRLAAASLTMFSTSLAFAQGCAMCYNNAAATKAAGQRALRSGILILLIPAVAMSAGIFLAALRRRDKFFGNDSLPSEFKEENVHRPAVVTDGWASDPVTSRSAKAAPLVQSEENP
jgi:hypothetical protein